MDDNTYTNTMYGGAPDECSCCWPHKAHDGDTCTACGPDDLGECNDLGCRYLFQKPEKIKLVCMNFRSEEDRFACGRPATVVEPNVGYPYFCQECWDILRGKK